MKLITKKKLDRLKEIKNKHNFDKIMIESKKIDKDKTISHLSGQVDQIFAILNMRENNG